MKGSFTKLFQSILDSTIWLEDSDTRVVWVTMLAMADRHGFVAAAVPGLARRAGVSLVATESALSKFLSPDPYSRSKEHDGRRIEEGDGGWYLLNYSKYREKFDEDERRERDAVRKRASRDVRTRPHLSADVRACPQASEDVRTRPRCHSKAEAEAEREEEREEEKEGGDPPKPPTAETPSPSERPRDGRHGSADSPLLAREGIPEPSQAKKRTRVAPEDERASERLTDASGAHSQEVREGWAEAYERAGAGAPPRPSGALFAACVDFARIVARTHGRGLREAARDIAAATLELPRERRVWALSELDPYAVAPRPSDGLDPAKQVRRRIPA